MKEIKQYIKKLADQEIFEAIGDAVSIQDADYKVLYQNKVHKDLIGDHIGKYCYQAYEKKEDICEGCPVAKTFEDGTIHKAERTVTTDNGTLYVDITASPLKDSTGKNIAVIEIVRDITKLKNVNISLKDKVRELEEFYDVAVSRELKMIELKKEIEKLKSELFQQNNNSEHSLSNGNYQLSQSLIE